MVLLYINLLLCLGSIYAYEVICDNVNMTKEMDCSINCRLSGVDVNAVTDLKIFHNKKRLLEFDYQTNTYVQYDNKNKIILNVMNVHGKFDFECHALFGNKEYKTSFYLNIIKRAKFLERTKYSNQYLILGEDDVIEVKVDPGTESPTLTWERLNATEKLIDLTADEKKRYTETKSGLSISSVKRSDAGKFLAVIQDEFRSMLKITINLYEKPVIKLDQTPNEAVENNKHEIRLKLTGVPVPNIILKKQGQLIMDSTKAPLKHVSFVQEHIILFDPININDAGDYEIIATNSAGKSSLKIKIVVNIPPKNVQIRQPEKNAKVPDESYLHCKCDAKPPATMYFFRNDEPDVHYTKFSVLKGTIVTSKNNSLRLAFKPTSYANAANYTCKVSNMYGHASNTTYLKLFYAPKIVDTDKKIVHGFWGLPFTFMAHVKAFPLPEVHWYHRNSVVGENSTFKLVNRHPKYMLNATFILGDDQFLGEYTVVAKNKYGNDSSKFKFSLFERLEPIKSLTAIKVTPTTVLFKIELPDNYNPDPPITIVSIFSKDIFKLRKFPADKNHEYLYDNLSPGQTRKFNAKLGNQYTFGKQCDKCPISVTTPAIRKPYSVIILSKPKSNEQHSYQLTWDRIFTGGSQINRIYVKTRRVSIQDKNNIWSVHKYIDNEWTVIEVTENIQNNMRGFLIPNLKPSTYYRVEVVLENNLGKSEPNAEFIFKTLEKSGDHTGVDTEDGDTKEIKDNHEKIITKSKSSSTVLIVAIMISILAVLVIIDISCFFLNKAGMIHLIFNAGKPNKPNPVQSYEERDRNSVQQMQQIEQMEQMLTNDNTGDNNGDNAGDN